MLLSHKIELRPTSDQIIYLDKACGSKRHCYNQLLEHFSSGKNKWSRKEASKYYGKILRNNFEWYKDVSAQATRNTIDDLDSAFKHFFRRVKAKQKPGFPKFKKKGIKDSFSIRQKEKFDVIDRTLKIEKLNSRIKIRYTLKFSGITKQVTIYKRVGKYFASILVETNDYDPKDINRQESVGVDLGIKNLAILSNGKVFGPNQKLKASLFKLAKFQRHLSRKKKFSNRRVRAKLKVSKLHFRVSNQRSTALHEISDYLTKTFNRIILEDLNVKGLVRNRKLSRAISDAGFGELRRQIEYKAKLRNCNVVIADRFFPSSKTCSVCGNINKDLKLSDRIDSCDCGITIDRDLNAAINLDNYGRYTLQRDLKRTQEISETTLVA